MTVREVAVIIQANLIATKLTYMILFGIKNLISEISALITQIETTTAANLVPRALFPAPKAREKRPGDEVVQQQRAGMSQVPFI